MLPDVRSILAANAYPVAADGEGIRVLQQRPGRVVARADTMDGPVVVKASAEGDAFVTEEAAIRCLAARGLPVASVIFHALGPPSCLVLSWTEGTALSSASPAGAQRACGELLRRVHVALGHLEGDRWTSPGSTAWDAWMAGWLNTALTWWVEVDPDGEDRQQRAWAWFHDLATLLATRGGNLILFDGRPEHILVQGEEIAGIIDVAELRAGDPAMDLGVLAVSDPALLAGVLAGYRPSDAEDRALSRLVPFYTFLRAISYAQWHQQFGTAAELNQALARLRSMEIPA